MVYWVTHELIFIGSSKLPLWGETSSQLLRTLTLLQNYDQASTLAKPFAKPSNLALRAELTIKSDQVAELKVRNELWRYVGNPTEPHNALTCPDMPFGTTGANDTLSNVPERFAASVNVFTTDSPNGLNAV